MNEEFKSKVEYKKILDDQIRTVKEFLAELTKRKKELRQEIRNIINEKKAVEKSVSQNETVSNEQGKILGTDEVIPTELENSKVENATKVFEHEDKDFSETTENASKSFDDKNEDFSEKIEEGNDYGSDDSNSRKSEI